MPKNNSYCTIQIDVDGIGPIGKFLGISLDENEEGDIILELGLDRILALLNEFAIKATFFVIAGDLKSERKAPLLRKIAEYGHEIACHSMTHNYLNSISHEQLREEIISSKDLIENFFNLRVFGFRAPGFAVLPEIVPLLEEAGYVYDSSVLNTSCAWLMQLFLNVRYPKWKMFTSPGVPYRASRKDIFRIGKSGITEIPPTTMPFFKFPMHLSYLIAGRAPYMRFVQAILEKANLPFVNYVIHPLDMLDNEDVKFNAKICGLNIKAESKLFMAKEMIGFFRNRYDFLMSKEMCGVFEKKTRSGWL